MFKLVSTVLSIEKPLKFYIPLIFINKEALIYLQEGLLYQMLVSSSIYRSENGLLFWITLTVTHTRFRCSISLPKIFSKGKVADGELVITRTKDIEPRKEWAKVIGKVIKQQQGTLNISSMHALSGQMN